VREADLKRLEGRTIRTATLTASTMPSAAGIKIPALELDDGTVITALRDAEGNGPGHLDIWNPRDRS
jgi:hypothetical protein